MPLTREQLSEVKNATDVMVKTICGDKAFIKRLVDSVSSGILEILGEKLGVLEKKVDTLNNDMRHMRLSHEKEIKTLNDKIEQLEQMTLNSPRDSTHTIQILEEIGEIKRRENNVVIFGVPEDEDDPVVIVRDIITNIIPNVNMNNPQVHRLGKRFPGKTRPIKLTLPNKADIPLLIKNNKTLQNNEKFRNVYIRPDQTVRQRDYFLTLRRELMERQKSGENDIMIKYRNGHPHIVKKKNL